MKYSKLNINQLDDEIGKIEAMIFANLVEKAITLLKIVKTNHPNISGIISGMGACFIDGTFTIKYLDGDIDDGGVWIDQEVERDNLPDDFTFYSENIYDGATDLRCKTEGILQLDKIVNEIIDRNFTTFLREINNKGVVFEFTKKVLSPFDCRTIEEIKKSKVYLALKEKNIPVFFECKMTQWEAIEVSKDVYMQNLHKIYERSQNKDIIFGYIEDAKLYD